MLKVVASSTEDTGQSLILAVDMALQTLHAAYRHWLSSSRRYRRTLSKAGHVTTFEIISINTHQTWRRLRLYQIYIYDALVSCY